MKGVSVVSSTGSNNFLEIRLDKIVARERWDYDNGPVFTVWTEGGHSFRVNEGFYNEAGNYMHSLFMRANDSPEAPVVR